MIVKKHLLGKTLVFTLCFLCTEAWSRVHDFETARLKSQGGAGIGSVLLNESVILNPAPLAVFKESTVTYQRENLELKDRNPNRASAPNIFNAKTHSNALIIAEGSSAIKGAVGYIDQVEGNDKRQRISSSVGAHLTDTTAVGVNYKYTKETSMSENNGDKFNYQSVGFGMTHFFSDSLTIGLMMDDLARSKGKNTKGGIGFQYVTHDLFTLMVDVGSNYAKNISTFQFYKVGMQFKLVDELYARAGVFTDQMNQEKGYGWGAGWVGPKIDLEFGLKTFKATKTPSYSILKGETQKEMSLSLSYIF